MRFQTEFNYILKIRDGQGLPSNPREGEVYDFEKTIERIYPLGQPILLVDDDLKVYGKVVIREYKAGNGVTSGKYEIIDLYDEAKSQLFTEDLVHSFEFIKNDK